MAPDPNPSSIRPITRRLISLGLTVATIVGVLGGATASPATAQADPLSADVDVVVTADDDLRITGDGEANRVSVLGNVSGYAVWVHRQNGQVIPYNLAPINGNVIIDLGGGDDLLQIGQYNDISFPANLVIDGGDGDDVIEIENADIAAELITDPGPGWVQDVFVTNTTVHDDFRHHAHGVTELKVVDSTVAERMLITSEAAQSRVGFVRSELGRLLMFTDSDYDAFFAQGSSLGANPVINLGDGDDSLTFWEHNEWSGRLVIDSGAGDDQMAAGYDDPSDGAEITPLWPVDLRMGPGDDWFHLIDGMVDDGAGSILRGGADTDEMSTSDHTGYQNATISSWEVFI